jgi:hypothetical protein
MVFAKATRHVDLKGFLGNVPYRTIRGRVALLTVNAATAAAAAAAAAAAQSNCGCCTLWLSPTPLSVSLAAIGLCRMGDEVWVGGGEWVSDSATYDVESCRVHLTQ